MADTIGKKHGNSPVAANYIIELKDGDTRSFVICKATLIIEEGDNWGGFTGDDLATYIEGCALAAAPLPGRPLHAEEFHAGPGQR